MDAKNVKSVCCSANLAKLHLVALVRHPCRIPLPFSEHWPEQVANCRQLQFLDYQDAFVSEPQSDCLRRKKTGGDVVSAARQESADEKKMNNN